MPIGLDMFIRHIKMSWDHNAMSWDIFKYRKTSWDHPKTSQDHIPHCVCIWGLENLLKNFMTFQVYPWPAGTLWIIMRMVVCCHIHSQICSMRVIHHWCLIPHLIFFRKTSFPSPYMSYVGVTKEICQLRLVADDLKMADCRVDSWSEMMCMWCVMTIWSF